MRAPNGLPRCFLPSDILEGAEAHVIRVGSSGEIPDAESDAFQGTITVWVERSEKPMLLYIKASEMNAFRFRIAKDANLAGIHIEGRFPQYVLTLPEGVPLTLHHSKARASGVPNDCSGGEYTRPPRDTPILYRIDGTTVPIDYLYGGGRERKYRDFLILQHELQERVGVPIAAYWAPQLGRYSELPAVVPDIGPVRFQDNIRRGHAWYADNPPPDLPLLPPDAPTLVVPDMDNDLDAADYVVSQGYAIEETKDINAWLCGEITAKHWAAGVSADPSSCDYGHRIEWRARRSLILLGPIELGRATSAGDVALRWPKSVTAPRFTSVRQGWFLWPLPF